MLFKVLKLRTVTTRGNLRALADVEVAVFGSLWIKLYGCRIIQQVGQRAYVSLPQGEPAEGKFLAAISGPPELRDGIQTAVLAAWTKTDTAP